MPRVLFVDHVEDFLGGAEINLIELLGHSVFRGQFEVACACPSSAPLAARLRQAKVPTFEYALRPALREHRVVDQGFSPLASIRAHLALRPAQIRLEAIIQEFGAQAIVSVTNKDHFAASQAAARRGIPSVWWVNDLLTRDFFPWPVRWVFGWRARRGARRLVAVSRAVAQSLEKISVPPTRIRTIHNGVAPEVYRPRSGAVFRRRFDLPGDAFLVGHAGRMTRWKGQVLVAEIADQLSQEEAADPWNLHYVFIGGTGADDSCYQVDLNRLKRIGFGASFTCHFIPFQDDAAEAIGCLDVLLHTSLRPEPFGRVIIEAMALEVPVIAARSGGVPEIIVDGQNGLLVETGNVAAYARALRRIASNNALRDRLKQEGRRTVINQFNLQNTADNWARLMHDVVRGAR